MHLTPEAALRPAGSVDYAISMADGLGSHLTALVFAADFTKPATFYGAPQTKTSPMPVNDSAACWRIRTARCCAPTRSAPPAFRRRQRPKSTLFAAAILWQISARRWQASAHSCRLPMRSQL